MIRIPDELWEEALEELYKEYKYKECKKHRGA